MENASDALIMAASVLLFIIALSVSISSFTNIKTQMDTIITESDTIDLVQDESGNYINYIKNADDVRTVGADTVISSARRVFKEQYTVYIKDPNGNITHEMSIYGDNYKILTEEFFKKLYSEIKDKKFKEYLGTYQEKTAEGVSSANKQTFRVITFVEI